MTDAATCPLPHQHPAQLDDGYTICRHHHTRLREDLTAAALVLDDLHQLLLTPAPIDGNDVRAAKTDPPAPCRLDILDLTDPRSDTPAVHILDCWTRFVTEERRVLTAPHHQPGPLQPHIGARQARWLTLHLDWLGRHGIANDAATELHDVWRWLRTAAGLAPPPPLFTCPVIHPDADTECGGPVYPSPYTFAVRCAACGETWDGQMALRRLGLVAS